MRKVAFVICLLTLFACEEKINIEKDKEEISEALYTSAEEWSNGYIEGFMETYWKSDKLQFIGSNGITYGWQQTLDNYKKGVK